MIPDWPTPEEDEAGIWFSSHEIDFTLLHEKAVSAWLQHALAEEGVDLHRIDFVFCSDEYLLDINRRHLDHDFYTDIITFPLNEDPLMAEVYISIDRVRENAGSLHVPFENELFRVMIHGVLHLCGYDDHAEDDVKVMREREEYYLRLIPSVVSPHP